MKTCLDYFKDKNKGKSLKDKVFNSILKGTDGVSGLQTGQLLFFNSKTQDVKFAEKICSIITFPENLDNEAKIMPHSLLCSESVSIYNHLSKQSSTFESSKKIKSSNFKRKAIILKILAKMLTPKSAYEISEDFKSLELTFNKLK